MKHNTSIFFSQIFHVIHKAHLDTSVHIDLLKTDRNIEKICKNNFAHQIFDVSGTRSNPQGEPCPTFNSSDQTYKFHVEQRVELAEWPKTCDLRFAFPMIYDTVAHCWLNFLVRWKERFQSSNFKVLSVYDYTCIRRWLLWLLARYEKFAEQGSSRILKLKISRQYPDDS